MLHFTLHVTLVAFVEIRRIRALHVYLFALARIELWSKSKVFGL